MTQLDLFRFAALGGLFGGLLVVACLWLGSFFAGAMNRRADRWYRIQNARARTLSPEVPHV